MITRIQTNTNVKETLGIGMPSIFISNITLSNSISVLQSKEDPHINHPSEIKPSGLQDIRDARDATSLNVSIKMILKETVDNDGNLAFISKGEVLKYIRICAVQCLNESVSQSITATPKAFLNPKSGLIFTKPQGLSGISYQKLDLINSIQGGANLILAEMQKKVTTGADFKEDFGNIRISELLNQLPFAKEQDAEGNVVYNIPLETKFTVSSKEGGSDPSFLSYFVYAYFDLDSFLQDTKEFMGSVVQAVPIPDDIILDKLMGEVSSDIVVANNQTQEDTFIFVDGSGKYYCGAKHQMPDGQYMKGKIHLEGQSYQRASFLTKKTIPNAKLTDNRQSINIGKVDFNYARTSEFITNDEIVISLAQNFGTEGLLKKKETIFSNLRSSSDIGGKHRFVFSLNIHDLLAKNTVFPGLLATIKKTDPNEYNSILSKVKIKDFRIIRTRVKSEQVVDSSLTKTSFSKNDKPLLIVQTSDDKTARLASKIQTSNKLARDVSDDLTQVGAISEIFIKNSSPGIRTFSGTDTEVSFHSTGLFQYEIDMTVEDPMTTYLKGKVSFLEKLLYGDNSTTGWEYYTQLSTYPEYSDDVLNRFNVKFLDFYNKNVAHKVGFVPGSGSGENSSSSFVMNIITKYVSTLFLLNSKENAASERTKRTKMVQYLATISSPNTGNPEGVQTIANLMKDLIEKLNFLVSQNSRFRKIQDVSGGSNAKANTPNIVTPTALKTFKVNHAFRGLFKAEETSLRSPYGYDFLSLKPNTAPANLSGLRVTSSKNITKRFLLETKKLFSSQDADIVISSPGANGIVYNPGDSINNKKFSFLAPSIAYLPRRPSVSILSKGSLAGEDIAELSDLMLDIVRYNTDPAGGISSADIRGQRKIDLPIKTQKRRMDLVEYFSQKGCSFETPKVLSTSVTSTSTTGKYFTSNSLFQKYQGGDLSEFIANTQEIFLAEEELVNSPVNPNKLLYSLTVLDDLDFINKELPEQERNNSLSFYRITSPSGGKKFKDALFAYSLIQALSVATGGGQPDNKKAPLTNSPNHVKALVLTAIKSPSAAKSTLDTLISNKKKDGFKDPMMYGYLNFNYRILNRVEVFRGFKSTDGNVQVTSSKWTDLRKTDLNPNGFQNDEFLLCRQVRYYSDLNGTLVPRLLEMPFFDEYFLITPQDLEDFLDISKNTDKLDSPASMNIFAQAGNIPQLPSGDDEVSRVEDGATVRGGASKARKDRYASARGGFYEPALGAESFAVRTEMTNSNVMSERNTVGGRTSPPTIDRPDRKKDAQKLKVFEKITTQEQIEMLGLMKLGKLAELNNINPRSSEKRTNGQIARGSEEITKEDLVILSELAKNGGLKQIVDRIKGAATSTQPKIDNIGEAGSGTTKNGGGSTY